jgi:hypothetical protein
MLDYGLNNLYPTPVWLGQTDADRCNILAAEILADTDRDSNRLIYNDGDRNENLFAKNNQVLNDFRDTVVVPDLDNYLRQTINQPLSHFREYKISSWLSKHTEGEFISRHNHWRGQLSAVYYLMIDENDTAGTLWLEDPRPNANRGYGPNFESWFTTRKYQPRVGDYVFFPSFVYHYVCAIKGSIRLALAVDIELSTDN